MPRAKKGLRHQRHPAAAFAILPLAGPAERGPLCRGNSSSPLHPALAGSCPPSNPFSTGRKKSSRTGTPAARQIRRSGNHARAKHTHADHTRGSHTETTTRVLTTRTPTTRARTSLRGARCANSSASPARRLSLLSRDCSHTGRQKPRGKARTPTWALPACQGRGWHLWGRGKASLTPPCGCHLWVLRWLTKLAPRFLSRHASSLALQRLSWDSITFSSLMC